MGERGIGYKRGKFCLTSVTYDGEIIYRDGTDKLIMDFKPKQLSLDSLAESEKAINSLTLTIISPTAIKKNGRLDDYLNFVTLIKSLKVAEKEEESLKRLIKD